MTGRGQLFAGVVAALLVGLAPSGAAADSRLVLPTSSLPGMHSTRGSLQAARRDLSAGLSRPVAAEIGRAALQSASAASRRTELRSDAFVFSSTATAKRVLGVWHRLHRGRATAIGSGGWIVTSGRVVTVAWRERERIGVIVLATRRGQGANVELAREYAVLAGSRLRIPTPVSAWDRVLSDTRPDGTLSQPSAMKAFVLAYGPLPGVRRPPGRLTPIADGTPAAEAIIHYYRHLTARQRAVVRRRLGIRGVVGAHSSPVAHAADLYDPTFQPDTELTALAQSFVPTYSGLVDPGFSLHIVAGITDEVVKSGDGGDVDADALPLAQDGIWGSGNPVTCRIRIMQPALEADAAYLKFVMAHEVFHCFQFDIRGDNAWTPLPLWIGEGTAEWAAMAVTQIPYAIGGGWLGQYVVNPQTPLFDRTYDASGFWGHTQDVNGDLWQRLPKILAGGTDSFASFAAAGADTEQFLNTWGSSIVRPINGGPEWHMYSPIDPPGLKGLAPPFTELTGSGIVSAPPFTLSLYRLAPPPSTPLLHISIQGPARLSPTSNYTDLSDVWFCTLPDGCHCPPDETSEIPHNYPLVDPTVLALAGDPGLGIGGGGTSGTIDAHSLQDFCVPRPAPHGGGSGTSNGDPYLMTFDGGGYGFQTAGEFTLVKSTVDSLEIQARQVPYPRELYPWLRRSLAMNTAFAMRVGPTIVELDKGSPLVLYINHRRDRLQRAARIRLPAGGQVDYGPQSTIVHWADGTVARILSIGDEGVNIVVKPSRRRAGLLTGLLGNDDGNGANDFVGRGGRRYDAATIESVGLIVRSRAQVRTLLSGFGRSWRITQHGSLFVYPRGRSTRSYLVRGFPRAIVALASIPSARRRSAARICRGAGVTNATLLVGCQIDYGATGDHRLATATGTVQHAAGLPGRRQASGPVTSRVPWTRLSSTDEQHGATVVPAIASTGGRLVSAYRRQSDQAIEATTFTAARAGVTGVTHSLAFTGWQSTTDPVLFTGAGGAPNMIVAGIRNGPTNDPLNGVDIAAGHPDGTFGAPALLSSSLTGAVSSATLAADGTTPLWTPRTPLALDVFSGSVLHDLTSHSPGVPVWPKLARDRSGRVWLAWYVDLGSGAGRYLMQLDPQTGVPVGPALRAPNSNDGPQFTDPITIACAQSCRLLYPNPGAADESLTSWAPGEAQGITVSPSIVSGHPQSPQSVAAAYTPGGRLWVAWNDAESRHTFATLGDARGAGGTLTELPLPAGFSEAEATAATTAGDRLVLATDWQNGTGAVAVWATVVNP